MPEEFIPVHTFNNLEEANLWQERLKAEGVESRIRNVSADTPSGERIEILVKEADAEKARQVLQQVSVHELLARPMNILVYLIGGAIVIVVGLLLIFQSSQLGVGIGAIVFGVLLVILYLYHRIKKQPHNNPLK